MRARRSLTAVAGKVLAGGLAYTLGSILVGFLLPAMGVDLPVVPGAAGPGLQMALLFLGGVVMAAALAGMAVGLAGRWWQRWSVLSFFVVVVNAVGTALEARAFSTLDGIGFGLVANSVSGVLAALTVSLLFEAPAGASSGSRLRRFVKGWLRPSGIGRLAVALIAFPFFYFLFGMIVAPHVTPYYERLDFLFIPPMSTLFAVLFIRSGLFLAASLVVIATWNASRVRLGWSLGFAHFAAVGLVGLISTTFFPAFLRWVHGVEILADSLAYAWALVWLFPPSPMDTQTVPSRESLPPEAETAAV